MSPATPPEPRPSRRLIGGSPYPSGSRDYQTRNVADNHRLAHHVHSDGSQKAVASSTPLCSSLAKNNSNHVAKVAPITTFQAHSTKTPSVLPTPRSGWGGDTAATVISSVKVSSNTNPSVTMHQVVAASGSLGAHHIATDPRHSSAIVSTTAGDSQGFSDSQKSRKNSQKNEPSTPPEGGLSSQDEYDHMHISQGRGQPKPRNDRNFWRSAATTNPPNLGRAQNLRRPCDHSSTSVTKKVNSLPTSPGADRTLTDLAPSVASNPGGGPIVIGRQIQVRSRVLDPNTLPIEHSATARGTHRRSRDLAMSSSHRRPQPNLSSTLPENNDGECVDARIAYARTTGRFWPGVVDDTRLETSGLRPNSLGTSSGCPPPQPPNCLAQGASRHPGSHGVGVGASAVSSGLAGPSSPPRNWHLSRLRRDRGSPSSFLNPLRRRQRDGSPSVHDCPGSEGKFFGPSFSPVRPFVSPSMYLTKSLSLPGHLTPLRLSPGGSAVATPPLSARHSAMVYATAEMRRFFDPVTSPMKKHGVAPTARQSKSVHPRTGRRAFIAEPGFNLDFLDRLPAEVLFLVCFYLEPLDLVRLAAVCKFAYHLVGRHPIWKQTVLRTFGFKYENYVRAAVQAGVIFDAPAAWQLINEKIVTFLRTLRRGKPNVFAFEKLIPEAEGEPIPEGSVCLFTDCRGFVIQVKDCLICVRLNLYASHGSKPGKDITSLAGTQDSGFVPGCIPCYPMAQRIWTINLRRQFNIQSFDEAETSLVLAANLVFLFIANRFLVIDLNHGSLVKELLPPDASEWDKVVEPALDVSLRNDKIVLLCNDEIFCWDFVTLKFQFKLQCPKIEKEFIKQRFQLLQTWQIHLADMTQFRLMRLDERQTAREAAAMSTDRGGSGVRSRSIDGRGGTSTEHGRGLSGIHLPSRGISRGSSFAGLLSPPGDTVGSTPAAGGGSEDGLNLLTPIGGITPDSECDRVFSWMDFRTRFIVEKSDSLLKPNTDFVWAGYTCISGSNGKPCHNCSSADHPQQLTCDRRCSFVIVWFRDRSPRLWIFKTKTGEFVRVVSCLDAHQADRVTFPDASYPFTRSELSVPALRRVKQTPKLSNPSQYFLATLDEIGTIRLFDSGADFECLCVVRTGDSSILRLSLTPSMLFTMSLSEDEDIDGTADQQRGGFVTLRFWRFNQEGTLATVATPWNPLLSSSAAESPYRNASQPRGSLMSGSTSSDCSPIPLLTRQGAFVPDRVGSASGTPGGSGGRRTPNGRSPTVDQSLTDGHGWPIVLLEYLTECVVSPSVYLCDIVDGVLLALWHSQMKTSNPSRNEREAEEAEVFGGTSSSSQAVLPPGSSQDLRNGRDREVRSRNEAAPSSGGRGTSLSAQAATAVVAGSGNGSGSGFELGTNLQGSSAAKADWCLTVSNWQVFAGPPGVVVRHESLTRMDKEVTDCSSDYKEGPMGSLHLCVNRRLDAWSLLDWKSLSLKADGTLIVYDLCPVSDKWRHALWNDSEARN